jgi:hypothetical protein
VTLIVIKFKVGLPNCKEIPLQEGTWQMFIATPVPALSHILVGGEMHATSSSSSHLNPHCPLL